jgi:MraZ protein
MDGPATLQRVSFPEGYENFSGGHPRTLDDKFRVVLPAGVWRDHFAEGAKLTLWVGCLALWTSRSYLSITAELVDRERRGEVARGTHRDFRQDTVDVSPDSQGRIVLPADLREAVGIGGKGAEVLLVGNGERVEIWDRARREADRAHRDRAALIENLSTIDY